MALRETEAVAIIEAFRTLRIVRLQSLVPPNGLESKVLADRQQRFWKRGQVAQVVERSPEKAGVGGSTPSLATTYFL